MDKTVQYKRTLRGSVGAGVSALFNGSGRRYYILEYKDASQYHKAGESQKIIIDQVELGRDGNCQVRFDETFTTVSRRHAAIVREGDRWKLVQLSKTNSTFLNGRPVDTEWYLENGDEIQLSIGGPRLGFIVPAGKQSLVSSIKMTERLELFRKQALKPYKTAIASLFALLIILGGSAGYVIYNQDKNINDLMAKTESQKVLFEKAREQWKKDSLAFAKEIAEAKAKAAAQIKEMARPASDDIATQLDLVKSSVYAVLTEVYIANSSEKQLIASSLGTGFLMSDGRFITARHCVEPWMFDVGQMQAMYALSNAISDIKIYSEVVAANRDGEVFSFTDNDFMIDRSYDSPITVPFELKEEKMNLSGAIAFGTKASLGNDWAYAKTSRKGSIIDGSTISSSLKSGMTVHLLGFPKGNGIADSDDIKKLPEPIYNSMSISRDGLNDSRCIMISQGVDHGNSGGPAFVMDQGMLKVIGLVSRGDNKSAFYNHLVPMSNLK